MTYYYCRVCGVLLEITNNGSQVAKRTKTCKECMKNNQGLGKWIK